MSHSSRSLLINHINIIFRMVSYFNIRVYFHDNMSMLGNIQALEHVFVDKWSAVHDTDSITLCVAHS